VRILLLNLYYPPDTSATAKMAETVATRLAREHEVTVVCGRPSYDPSERRSWKAWQREWQGNVEIVRVGSTDFPRWQMMKRLLNYLTYAALAVPCGLFTPADVILAMTDPPFEGIIGAVVAMLKRKPFVYNIRDLYPDMAVGGGILRSGLLAWVWERLHRWALRRAARVIVLGRDVRTRITAKGILANRIEIVRDGVDFSLAQDAEIDPEVVAQIRNGFRFVLVHAGNLGFYGDWDALLEAARGFGKDNSGIGIVFIGEGAQKPRLQAAAAGLRNVRFLPFFPASKIPSVLAAADAHIVTLKHGLEGVVVPSKLYGILAAGKPVLGLAPEWSDIYSIVKETGCGYIDCPLDGLEDFVEIVRDLSYDPKRLRKMGEAAQAAAPDYDRVEELQKFAGIINHLKVEQKIKETTRA
jgi:putative colanic acid biosynthesis glycosyltransferase WcaI